MGLKVNLKKTKTCLVLRRSRIITNESKIENVNKYRYLGQRIMVRRLIINKEKNSARMGSICKTIVLKSISQQLTTKIKKKQCGLPFSLSLTLTKLIRQWQQWWLLFHLVHLEIGKEINWTRQRTKVTDTIKRVTRLGLHRPRLNDRRCNWSNYKMETMD